MSRSPIPHEMRGSTEYKLCRGCAEWHPLAKSFYRSKRERDGFQPKCKTCSREAIRCAELKRLYGISREQYLDMMLAQGGVCVVCQEACARGGELSVDHNHETGEVRALLCRACNSALGLLREDPERMIAMIDYLGADVPKRIR